MTEPRGGRARIGPDSPGTAGSPEEGPRLIVFHYVISIVILSFKRASGIKVIPPGKSAVMAGIPYSILTFVAGWWGIPWGPIWTIQALVKNFRGGTNVTEAVYAAAAESAAFARAAATAQASGVGPPKAGDEAAPAGGAALSETRPGPEDETP